MAGQRNEAAAIAAQFAQLPAARAVVYSVEGLGPVLGEVLLRFGSSRQLA
jgi:hypothetical protein